MMHTALAANCLNQKVILVTGAANGIGAAVAETYAEHGASVILLDKDIPSLERIYDRILTANNPTPAIYPLDLKGASINDYEELAEAIITNFNQLDGLVHCAASLGQLAPFPHQQIETWLETLHINLTAAYLLTRACYPLLRQQAAAKIIFTTDHRKNDAYCSAYGISKAAIETLAQQLTEESEAQGRLQIHCIDPGVTDTQLQRQAFPALPPDTLPAPNDVVALYLKHMAI